MEFRQIPGIDNRYVAGADGRIYSQMRAEMIALSAGFSGNGHYRVVSILLDNGRRVTRNVHNLVCRAFHGASPSDKHGASHLDGNSHNNVPSNLKWETQADNIARKADHGTQDRGLDNSRASLTAESLAGVRSKLAQGVKHEDIAAHYGVSRTVVSAVLHGKKYAGF